MIYLRQSTASQEVPLGHFVDDTDGKTAETGLTIANTDIKVWKSGATTLANKNSGGATHISGGIYYAVLDATDTDTIGPLVLFVAVSGALAVRLECTVIDEAQYDAMFGTTAFSTLTAAGVRAELTTELGRIDAAVSSRLASAGYTAPLDAAGTRSAVGLASANLDTQLSAIAGYIDTEVAAIKAVTDLLPNGGALTSLATAAALTDAAADITTLLGRLTSTRAGLLDELDPATAGKMAAEIDVLIARLTSLRAGYLDNLSAGAVATASALAAVAADLPSRITKNTALAGFTFPMFDSADHVTPKTGLTVTAQRSLDGAALASCTNAVTEIGNGLYKIDLAAGDLNGDIVTLRFTATGADATILTLATQPT